MAMTILVPLDGSSLAERAMPFAETLAVASDARVLLLYARTEDCYAAEKAGTPPALWAGRYLEAQSVLLRRKGLTVSCVMVAVDIVEAVVAQAKRCTLAAVVMATHGCGLLGRGAGGSVAERLLMQLTTPVLLIRAWHSAMTCRRFTGGLRIIVPLDGSALAEAALPCAQATAAVFHGELILVHIVSRLPPWPDVPAANAGHSSASDRAQLQAATYLHTIAKRLDGDQVRVRVVVGVGDVADTIASLARDHDAALVVMATHGRTGNLRTSLGTVARSVLWHCDSPVVLLRPAAPDLKTADANRPKLFAPLTAAIEPGDAA